MSVAYEMLAVFADMAVVITALISEHLPDGFSWFRFDEAERHVIAEYVHLIHSSFLSASEQKS